MPSREGKFDNSGKRVMNQCFSTQGRIKSIVQGEEMAFSRDGPFLEQTVNQ